MAPKKSISKVATPMKGVVKSKACPSARTKSKLQLDASKSEDRDLLKKSLPLKMSLLQEFVQIDRSADLTCWKSPRSGATAQHLHDQAGRLSQDLADHQHRFDAAKVRFEAARVQLARAQTELNEAEAELSRTQSTFQTIATPLRADLKFAKLRCAFADHGAARQSAVLKPSAVQSASNFEYRSKGRSAESAGSGQHSLHVSFRQLDKSPGSKDWKALTDLADPEKLKSLQMHRFPYDAEAEIGPSSGPSCVESLHSSASIIEKLEHLQDEAFSYVERSICFKADGGNEPEQLRERWHQFRAYIDLEKDSCDGPFNRMRHWLRCCQKRERKIAALFVRRNETQHGTPPGSDGHARFQIDAVGVLYVCDDASDGEMFCLQVKRYYCSSVCA
jgi:hypothetical protein